MQEFLRTLRQKLVSNIADTVEQLLLPGYHTPNINVEALKRMGVDCVSTLHGKLGKREPRARVRAPDGRPRLWASEVGDGCSRKLHYKFKGVMPVEKMLGNVLYKFAFGDIIESMTIALLEHTPGLEVRGLQERVEMEGATFIVSGKSDVVVNNVVYDVKSMAPFSFDRMVKKGDVGTWGYQAQVSVYYHELASKYNLTGAGIWGVNKVTGKQHAHQIAPLTKTALDGMASKHAEGIMNDDPPVRAYEPKAHGSSGNMALPTKCKYCPHKWECHPGLRMFVYSSGPEYLTQVVHTPKVPEIHVNDALEEA
jgi:hypothetical protein